MFFSHFPKDRNCEICQRTKIARAPCRRRMGGVVPCAENCGDLITADHKVLSEGCESRNNHRYAVVMQDLATQWIQSYPCKTKTSQETQRSLQKFLEPNRKPKVIYTDNSLEFGKACEELSWNHCTSTPHRSETNGIGERAVRRVKEGISAVLLQSGLDENWWADCEEWYTYLRNIQDLLSDGKTPYERRFGDFFFENLSFRLVHWLSITLSLRKTSQESINLERKSYLDCSSDTHCTREEFGRVTWWLQTLRSWKRWTHQKSTLKDSMQRKWYFPKKMENSYFQPQMDEINFLEETSGTENIHLDTESLNSRRTSHWFSWRIRRVSSTTSRLTSGCRWSRKWFVDHFRKLRVPPSRRTQSQILLAERRIIPYSTEIHWRLQNYKDEFGCYARTPHRWLL